MTDLILKNLELEGGMKLVAILRLVSKECRDAVAQYAGRASCSPGAYEPFKICQILPGMRGLQVLHKGGRLDARPLSKCSQLTRLVFARQPGKDTSPPIRDPERPSTLIYFERDPPDWGLQNMTFDAASGFLRPIYQADIDISHLPHSLRALELDDVLTYPADHSATHFTGLTELSYYCESFKDSLLWDLLDCLPHLQVRQYNIHMLISAV